MMNVSEIRPSLPLRGYVRSYHYAQMHLGAAPMSKPMTARPEQMMQFAVRERFTVVDRTSGAAVQAPAVVVVGRQTRRNLDLVAVGGLSTLTVHFEPTGFHRLFHVAMGELTNLTPDAVDVLGPAIRTVHERITDSSSVAEMIQHVETFLVGQVERSRPWHPVQAAAAALLDGRRSVDVRAMAAESLLSARQFERVFRNQIGVGPKLFHRIVRFADVLQAKSDQPDRNWADITVDAGYFDQTHFIRDCHAFGTDTPAALMRTWIDCRP